MRPPRLLGFGLVVAGISLVGAYLRRRAPDRFEPVVRCDQGHLYRSLWVPGGSLKAVRWFGRRYQRCPVGRHWSWTRRVDTRQLSIDQLAAANAVHDVRVP